MVLVLLSIALSNLGLGFYLGTMLLRLLREESLVLAVPALLDQAIKPLAAGTAPPEQALVNEPGSVSLTGTAATTAANRLSPKAGWNAASKFMREDIVSLSDRIRYVASAHDKQLARDVAAELRSRTYVWQKHFQDLLVTIASQLEQDPTAEVDLETSELCLAQIETLQTNLELLDWSDDTDMVLQKLEREVEAVKKLLPASSKAS